MLKKVCIILALAGFLFAAAPVRGSASQEISGCIKCHPKEASAEELSVHRPAGVTCVECHGGDPKAEEKEKAKAPETGYRGKFTRVQLPEACGSCHSDVRKMNPYGLPTDQLDQYRYSHHGEALYQKGITDVATCVDCHGAHGILKPSNPESPTYPKNIPATCGKCHSDEEKMKKHGLEANQEADYRQSVHAEMLFEKNDLSAPTCVVCHGNHSAVPPGFTKVGQVCGKCHIKELELFKKSPHAEPAARGDIETCVTCHSNHKIVRPSEKLFKVCTLCHHKGDKAFNVAKTIYGTITQAHEQFEEAEERVSAATRKGLPTEDEQILLNEAKTYMTQLPQVHHMLDLSRLQQVAEQVNSTSQEIIQSLDRKDTYERRKKLALIPVSLFLLSMSFLFWLKKREIERRD